MTLPPSGLKICGHSSTTLELTLKYRHTFPDTEYKNCSTLMSCIVMQVSTAIGLIFLRNLSSTPAFLNALAAKSIKTSFSASILFVGFRILTDVSRVQQTRLRDLSQIVSSFHRDFSASRFAARNSPYRLLRGCLIPAHLSFSGSRSLALLLLHGRESE